ncbi:hypothetical protein C9994_10325 [Marivirga lumbricoides]|uniref:Uncharacterized protein n=1 Tax=Marivirga lumbricoides TaxID=1046115 RepID=A0A2T4DPL1_9BACT|nr:hypothetical protein C9994_10325 [Marivirga lumbricoides]
MNSIKIIGLLSLVLSYLILGLNFIFDNAILFYIAWFFGIVSVISNVLWADKLNLNRWLIIVFTMCGILWVFPVLLITYFGIPCMLLFLILGIYIHTKKLQKKEL